MNDRPADDPGALLSREANALCGIFQFARDRQYPEAVVRQIKAILDERLLALAAATRAAQRRKVSGRSSTSNAA